MSATEMMNNRVQKTQRKLVQSIVINIALPWVLYILLRRIFTNDTVPLSITAAIPAVRTVFLWVWRRKVDWSGLIGAFGFVIALGATLLSGGSPLPIKLIHPIVFGIIGVVCIISAATGKPLLTIIFKIITHGKGERFNSLEGRKKSTIMTALLGGIFLVSSTVHIIMALVLPTAAFVVLSHIVSWITILTLVVSGKLIVPKVK